jgi:hypothetical protein
VRKEDVRRWRDEISRETREKLLRGPEREREWWRGWGEVADGSERLLLGFKVGETGGRDSVFLFSCFFLFSVSFLFSRHSGIPPAVLDARPDSGSFDNLHPRTPLYKGKRVTRRSGHGDIGFAIMKTFFAFIGGFVRLTAVKGMNDCTPDDL